jgi:hypothetical protein
MAREREVNQARDEKQSIESVSIPAADEHGTPQRQRGAIGYIFLWLLGIPIPILVLIYLLRGCA